jgi:large subunit ribosomal protein L25
MWANEVKLQASQDIEKRFGNGTLTDADAIKEYSAQFDRAALQDSLKWCGSYRKFSEALSELIELPITVDARAFRGSLDPSKRRNTVIEMTIEDEGQAARDFTVMVKEYQIDPIRRDLTHIDLIVIDKEKEVESVVPIELTGKAKGLILGGQLHVVLHRMSVRCKPANIPAKVVVDVTELDVGGVLHLSDVRLPEGVVVAATADLAIVTCVGETGGEEAAAAS